MSLVQLSPGALYAGEFRVVRPLSEGGMGAVYVVEQHSTGKQRALKIMHPQLVGDESLRQRFVLEARIGARIESDHVIEVVAAGIDAATGTPWLAMELLQGETLAERVETMGPRHLDEVREVVAQLCHALGAAHRVGIVHRDLKPENVFLAVPRREGVRFVLKVLDFGIAKLVAEAETKQTAAMGSPLWMAPEQADLGDRISPATDVWALGLLVFWMLTGKELWKGAHVESPNAVQLLSEMKFTDLPSASDRAREYGRADRLPPGFDAWFARCVVRAPAARYVDAHAARLGFEEMIGLRTLPTQQPIAGGPAGAPAGNGSAAGQTLSSAHASLRSIPELELAEGTEGPPVKTQASVRRTPPSPIAATQPVGTGSPASAESAPSTAAAPVAEPAPLAIALAPAERVRASSPLPLHGASPAPHRASSPSSHTTARTSYGSRPSSAARRVDGGGTASWWKWAALGAVGLLAVWLVLRVVVSAAERAGSRAVGAPASASATTTASAPAVATIACPPDMVAMAGGVYDGSAGKMTIDPFCIDRTEVTVKAYLECVRQKKCTPAAAKGAWPAPDLSLDALYNKSCNAGRTDRLNHPVNCVDAKQADAYCAAQGRSLPTELQWEWAARGRSERWPYPWGKEPPDNHMCWSQFTRRLGTCAVGEFARGDTPWGVRDLDGDVREWLRAEGSEKDREYCGSDWTDTRASYHALGWCGRIAPTIQSGFIGLRCAQ